MQRDERIYVQVCRRLPEESDREIANLLEIKDHYPKYVVTLDELAAGNINGVKIVHLADFLLSHEYWITNDDVKGKDPFAACLISVDCTTTSNMTHSVSEDNGHSAFLLQYMENAYLIASLKIEISQSLYLQTAKTQKDNLLKFSCMLVDQKR